MYILKKFQYFSRENIWQISTSLQDSPQSRCWHTPSDPTSKVKVKYQERLPKKNNNAIFLTVSIGTGSQVLLPNCNFFAANSTTGFFYLTFKQLGIYFF